MRTEVIQNIGDLRRERWVFDLSIGISRDTLYLDHYAFETKESNRHRKWQTQTHWDRLMRRENNVDKPPLPQDIIKRAKEDLIFKIAQLEVTC